MAQSEKFFARALRKIPGGVNSPVRAWKSVGGVPRFIARGKGSYLYDADGERYIDFIGSWGPLILGHAHPQILQALKRKAAKGTTFGAPTEGEVDLAELVSRIVPSVEKLRLVSSGYRSDHERDSLSSRIYSAHEIAQIRRLLPWTLRRFAGESGFGCGDTGTSG
jgi:glutamate-1-semialdehyde 2,1-aminomutase